MLVGRKLTRSAFTLVELVVVLACLALAAVIFLPSRSKLSPKPSPVETIAFSQTSASKAGEIPGGLKTPAMPTLARICTPANARAWVSVSGFCHALDYYGLGPTDLPVFTNGFTMLQALTDESVAIRTFGKSPFYKTENGIRFALYDEYSTAIDLGEAHQDQCLALFARLDLPLTAPVHLRAGDYTLNDLLAETKARFTWDQHEIAWSAMALAKYVPPQPSWINKVGTLMTFDDLVDHLLATDLNNQKCAGLHVLEALILIQKADAQNPVLSSATRQKLTDHLKAAVAEITRRQRPDGSWNKSWCAAVQDQNDPMTPFQMSFLVTGHLCEILPKLAPSLRPPDELFYRAAQWLGQAVNSDEIHADGFWVCPFTHASRGARDVFDGQFKFQH